MDSRWTDSIGVALLGHGLPGSALGWARDAERAGLGSVWLIEDYYHPGAFVLAGAIAAATERIGIGLGVVNPYTRHPALVAMETAALAGLAPGRVALGLGSSNRRWIEQEMAIPFKTPLRGLREGTEIVKRLLAGERVTYTGEVFSVNGVALETPPPERVAIVFGVKGPAALAMAAEMADGILGSILSSPAHVRRVRTSTRDRVAVLAYVPMVVADDRAQARALVRPLLARYLAALHGQSILADAGIVPEQTQQIRDALAARRPTDDLVGDDLVDRLAVAGTPADCRAALECYAAAGLDAPVAVIPAAADLRRQLERIGSELAPAWKEMRRR
jgi:5,10-methylenetetrahydromethanopterin reductase